MSKISIGYVFSKTPLKERDLAAVNQILSQHTVGLNRSRKGRHWTCSIRNVVLTIDVEAVDDILFDCEDDLLDCGLLPEPGICCISLVAPADVEAHREINDLCFALAKEIDGITKGAYFSH